MTAIADKLQKTLDKAVDGRKVFGTTFRLKYKDFEWSGASGNLAVDSPYFTASTTKLFTTALIMRLRQQKKLELDDKLTRYFSPAILNGLHVYKGRDYSGEISIRNLLAHTSGIPDYFQGRNDKGDSLEKELFQGRDRHWTFEQAIELSKRIRPRFAPNTKGKALYSDTNFQLLGKIVEQLNGKPFAACIDEQITGPLGMTGTYLYLDAADTRPRNMYYKDREVHIPLAMTSFGADGGIVTTTSDMLKFIEAFFAGVLFPSEYLPEMKIWNPIFLPLRAGVGIHLYKLPGIFNYIIPLPELYGHSGLSGALAYCNPEKGFYIAGTVNQTAYPSTSFQLATRLYGNLL